MKITWLSLLILLNTLGVCAQEEKKWVADLLNAQANAWNEGDINRFMATYWRSDELQFIGESGLVKGWEATLKRYQTRYPDRSTMGTLKFNLLEVQCRSKKVLSAVGQYELTRPAVGDLRGFFTLILMKIKGRWLIVSDTTVASPQGS